jgi:transcriptional regulator with XRE-family HTH domain
MPTDPLPQYLKMFRKRSGLSQRELAALLGCKSGSKISRYERGGRRPTFEALLAYEVIFRVALDGLFRGEHTRVRRSIRQRAQRLSRTLDSRAFTPAMKCKLDFLADLIYPPDKS